MIWPTAKRDQVLAACREGVPYPEIEAASGVPRGTIGYWVMTERRLGRQSAPPRTSNCPMCDDAAFDHAAYALLLGLYLGDGHIVSKARQHHLAISCDNAWPGLIDTAERTLKRVMPHYATSRVPRAGCTDVTSYTKHWICLLPQHGPGAKHTRPIQLTAWQKLIVRKHPWALIRGLIHSDGCRVTNWATRGGRRYEYPRYLFTNKSDDIRTILTDTLDQVGVEWRAAKRSGTPYNISIARRASVALMDEHVGPKH